MARQTVSLLVIDDDEIDRELIVRSLRKARVANPVHLAVDGADGLDVLRGTGGRTRIERPYLIILDWKMPGMNGEEFLEELRADPTLANSTVLVLTTSDDPRDIDAAYSHLVAGYIVKERAGQDFMDLIEFLGAYWRIVELAEGPSSA